MRKLGHESNEILHSKRREKGEIIADLLSRAKNAHDNGYYIESLGVLAIILEERIFSVNSKLIPTYPNNKSLDKKTLGSLINDFLELYKLNPSLKIYFSQNLVNYLNWNLQIRNNIFHHLIDDDLIQDNKDLSDLSDDALVYVREFINSAQRWKKHK